VQAGGHCSDPEGPGAIQLQRHHTRIADRIMPADDTVKVVVVSG
jgi:hypothetical protein